MISTIYDSIKEWNFMQDNQQLIEGEIENFLTGQNGSESFYVGEEYFCYPSSDNGLYAYDIPKRNGNSVIIGEGQFVRLTYYKFNGVNNICKIEVRKTGDGSPGGDRGDGSVVSFLKLFFHKVRLAQADRFFLYNENHAIVAWFKIG